MKKIFFFLFFAFLLIGSASALTNVTNCGNLGTMYEIYVLQNNLSSNSTCLSLNNYGITLDCNGFSIIGNGTGYGVHSNQDYTNIVNCDIRDFARGVDFSSIDNGRISFSNFTLNLEGLTAIDLRGSNLNNISYNKIQTLGTNTNGISLAITSNSNFIYKNDVYGEGEGNNGFYHSTSAYNQINENNFTSIYFISSTNNSLFRNDIEGGYSFNAVNSLRIENIYGRIIFTSALNETGTNLSNDIQISNNFAFVNSTKTGLNQTANVSLFNAGNFTDPIIYRDGLPCPAEICSNFQQNGNNFTFSVNAWSNYSIGEELELNETFPSVSITYPLNTTYSSNVTHLDYTIQDADNCSYSTDNGVTNHSITCENSSVSINSDYELNTWIIYVSDEGNTTFDSVTFFVTIPEEETQEETPLSSTGQIMVSAGAGLGIFMYLLSQALPILLIGLAFAGIVILIGFGIVKLVTHLSR